MRISKSNPSKKKINSSTAAVNACDDAGMQEIVVVEDTDPICTCKYQSAIDLILGAIESLAEIAKDDEIAKDSIANLGVVLMDLKGEC